MRSSPRRPLILKRRKLSLPPKDGAGGLGTSEQRPAPLTGAGEQRGQNSVSRADINPAQNLVQKTGVNVRPEPSLQNEVLGSSTPEQNQVSETTLNPDSTLGAPASCTPQSPCISTKSVTSEIKVMGHPTIPDTQLVVLPPNFDMESIIQALTARGREMGGPNKFILISGSPSFHTQAEKLGFQTKGDESATLQIEAPASAQTDAEEGKKVLQVDSEELNISLTNIQWLGKMTSDGLGSCSMTPEPEEKENLTPMADCLKMEEEIAEPATTQPWHDSISERPPYSYMALIQFAINSTPSKRMTLKDIYTWIEDHFPYFKYVAKPGWKNSIRHNLSLHDMFVRESPSNNKISYWTIHPQANRCLTLDQVFKVSTPNVFWSAYLCKNAKIGVGAAGLASSSTPSMCSEPKRPIPDLSRSSQTAVVATKPPERKMKPLLPRIDSYLIPVQFPITQSVLFSPVEAFCADPGPSGGAHFSKRVKIAPKIPPETEDPLPLSQPVEVKAESVDIKSPAPFQCRRASGSRRKQQLVTPRSLEPELVLPDSSASDSGLDTDFSFLQDTQAQEGPSQITQDEDYAFKTPIKERLKPHASSTPSKPRGACTLPDSEFPLSRDLLPDFSPVRFPCSTALTPFKDNYGAVSFGETPFKDLPIFGSPSDFMGTFSPSSPQSDTLDTPKGMRKHKRCSKELLIGNSANRSLLEGLVLDTKDESLSKILLDISFSGLDDDNSVGGDNSYLGQLLSELR
ncbi:PREDICTED: forkhead box protein M1 [Nanorana parkeri]|uniref:forkhead box protein M1 n=1 Tax=Nanorana parkeri TaxID=125878 RepID=UPI0008549887|nr:PREDICTED: forkhead box protein M1 [Nanorana parkeri]